MAKPINGNQIKPMVDALLSTIRMYTLITMSLLHIYLLLLPRSLFLSKRVGYDKNFAAVVMSHTTNLPRALLQRQVMMIALGSMPIATYLMHLLQLVPLDLPCIYQPLYTLHSHSLYLQALF